ncbi:Hypothetical protein SMAX5B_016989 [Scophthalmus maximus]|uniref:Uncharacterized protein n=1 Tax=Scophthalmus maximus TaxID=52904 RepID=A0A2U9B9K4_SCOMX|nr:Hypothetical protein SMAX5B_016989 [Scophthalmus maximus]
MRTEAQNDYARQDPGNRYGDFFRPPESEWNRNAAQHNVANMETHTVVGSP